MCENEFNKKLSLILYVHPILSITLQNDHGGPLVAIVGQQERLIGIALNSVYNKKYQCNGPSLYFSTARAKDLINCMLSTRNEKFYV